jgi:endonuclease/exonuclease/phosphatase family metal-dependent hydrolase
VFADFFSHLPALISAFLYLLTMSFQGADTVAPLPGGVPAPNPAYQSATETVKVMSFNVSNDFRDELALEKRLGRVTDVIFGELPDSFGLQEANNTWRGALPNALQSTYKVVGNVGTDALRNGDGDPIFYRADKFDAVARGVFWLNDRPLFKISSTGWDAQYKRMAVWVVLKNKATGFTYLHVNTHVDHIGPQSRDEAATLIGNFINKINLPTVLTGDFNALRSESSYALYLSAGLTDTAVAAPDADFERHTFNGWAPPGAKGQKAVDFIFANGYFLCSANYKVDDNYGDLLPPSDHYAISCEVTFGPQTAV